MQHKLVSLPSHVINYYKPANIYRGQLEFFVYIGMCLLSEN